MIPNHTSENTFPRAQFGTYYLLIRLYKPWYEGTVSKVLSYVIEIEQCLIVSISRVDNCFIYFAL